MGLLHALEKPSNENDVIKLVLYKSNNRLGLLYSCGSFFVASLRNTVQLQR